MKKEISFNKPEFSYYNNFINENSHVKIDSSRMDLCLLCGDERQILKVPTNGDSSLVLKYQDKEGAVISIKTESEEISILQLQGARSRVSYKVATGIDWVSLFGDQVLKVATCEENCFRFITMPCLEKIDGLYETGTEKAIERYVRFAKILGLRFSKEDLKYIKELN